jgi:hypothetical protein
LLADEDGNGEELGGSSGGSGGSGVWSERAAAAATSALEELLPSRDQIGYLVAQSLQNIRPSVRPAGESAEKEGAPVNETQHTPGAEGEREGGREGGEGNRESAPVEGEIKREPEVIGEKMEGAEEELPPFMRPVHMSADAATVFQDRAKVCLYI